MTIALLDRENFVVRTSERSKFNACFWAWYWAYVDLMQPKSRKHYFVFGDLVHRALADYYIPETKSRRRRGPHPAQTFLKIYETLELSDEDGFKIEGDEDKWATFKELGEEILTNYIDRYGKDLRWLSLYPEMPFRLRIYDVDGRFVGWYTGVADCFVRDMETGHYGLLEHKTKGGGITYDHLVLDEQFGTYWDLIPRWLAEQQIIKPDMKMDFMLYNGMRKDFKDDRPKNADGHALNNPTQAQLREALEAAGIEYKKAMKNEELKGLLRHNNINPDLLGDISKRQQADLFGRMIVRRSVAERDAIHERIVQQMDEMYMRRTGMLPVYKTPGDQCRYCEFRDLCEIHEQAADWTELADLTMKYDWDPYAQHVASLEIA